VNTCTCEHTESCHVADELSDAKGKIERLEGEGRWSENVRIRKRLTDAKREIERLTTQSIQSRNSEIGILQDDLTAAKGEIEGLRTVTESFGEGADAVKHMAQEILDGRRLQSQLAAAKLEIDRVNRIAEEELDEVNAKVDLLRQAIKIAGVSSPQLQQALADTEDKG